MSFRSPTDHNLRSRLKASLLGVVGSFVLFAAYLAVPPLGIFSGILAPFPVAYSRLLHGRIASSIVLLGTVTAISALFGIFAGCLYLGMCGMIGFLMPELLIRNSSGSRAILLTTLANLLILAAGVFAYISVSGVDLHKLLSTEISDSMKQAVTLYERAGVKGEELELLKRTMTNGVEMLSKLYPALVTALFVIIAGCNLALIKKSTAKIDVNISIAEFSHFRNPDFLVWLLIAAGFAMLLPVSAVTTPALNILLIVTLLYFFQGMAVVSAVVAKNSVSKFLKIILYAMLIIQPYLMALVAGIGLFDLWVDFRTPKTQENL